MQLRSRTVQILPTKSYELVAMIEAAKVTKDRGQKLAKFIQFHKFLHENCEYFTNPRFAKFVKLVLEKTAEYKQEVSRIIEESDENLEIAFKCYYYIDMVHQKYTAAYCANMEN